MPLTGNPSHDIPVELAAGKPRKQAIAIALSEKREHAHDASSLVQVEQKMFDQLVVGKSYKFDGKIGKVLSKENSGGGELASGWGISKNYVRVQWREVKDDGMNAHLDPGSREDARGPVAKKEGNYWLVTGITDKTIKFPISANETEYEAITYAWRVAGDPRYTRDSSRSTGTLMDILRGDSERRDKTVDMLIEASHNLTKRAASLFDKKGS